MNALFLALLYTVIELNDCFDLVLFELTPFFEHTFSSSRISILQMNYLCFGASYIFFRIAVDEYNHQNSCLFFFSLLVCCYSAYDLHIILSLFRTGMI